jgi:3-dehydrosphinganine reductase
MNIGGACAIITGGSSGIGKCIAERLAQQGANVFLVARREKPLKNAMAELERNARGATQRFGYFAGDMSEFAVAEEAVRQAEAVCGPTAILVNSHGCVNPGYVEQLPISGMETELKVNYLGTVYMIKQVVTGMIERRRGWILSVSSLGGLKGVFGYTGYAGSKFAIVGFSEALRSELRPYGIVVSVLCPPDVDTPMFENENKFKPIETMKISEGAKLMQPDAVAAAALKGLEKRKFLIIPNFPGKLFYIVNRLAPWMIDRFIDSTIDKVRKQRGV